MDISDIFCIVLASRVLNREPEQLEKAFNDAMEGSRGDVKEIIIEEFIHFDSEFTLLTVTQKNGPTLFCPPIGHVQKGGDYRESWQPFQLPEDELRKAEDMAEKIKRASGAHIRHKTPQTAPTYSHSHASSSWHRARCRFWKNPANRAGSSAMSNFKKVGAKGKRTLMDMRTADTAPSIPMKTTVLALIVLVFI